MATRMDRAGRKKQILGILAERWMARSTHSLARKCGMKPSPHFRKIVYEMYEEKLIDGFASKRGNKMDVFYWHARNRDEMFGQPELPLDQNDTLS